MNRWRAQSPRVKVGIVYQVEGEPVQVIGGWANELLIEMDRDEVDIPFGSYQYTYPVGPPRYKVTIDFGGHGITHSRFEDIPDAPPADPRAVEPPRKELEP